MAEPQETSPRSASEEAEQEPKGVDLVTVLYILGGIPAIVAFVMGLFFLVNLFPGIPA